MEKSPDGRLGSRPSQLGYNVFGAIFCRRARRDRDPPYGPPVQSRGAERSRKIIRHRCFETFPLTGARMLKAKLPGVQHLAGDILGKLWRIDFISHHGMTEMMKMNSNLMSAAAV